MEDGNSNKEKTLFLPVFKTKIPIKMHREFPKNAKIGGATVSKTPTGKYFVSFVTQFDSKAQLESASEGLLGVDINIKGLVYLTERLLQLPNPLLILRKEKEDCKNQYSVSVTRQKKRIGLLALRTTKRFESSLQNSRKYNSKKI